LKSRGLREAIVGDRRDPRSSSLNFGKPPIVTIIRSHRPNTPIIGFDLPVVNESSQWQRLAADVMQRCDALARCSDEPERITRLFCTPAMREAHRLTAGWMQAAGMSVRCDPAGNLRGAYMPPGCDAKRRLLLGSHLDTVADAGRYDGILGVMMGIAVVDALREAKIALPWAIEVIGFSEEEGVRFRTPFIGSRAIAGTLDDATLSRCDDAGVSIAAALREFGCDATKANECCATPGEIVAFIEPHIEQGPLLEKLDEPLGVVTAIAGQTRLTIEWVGEGGHAGTAPMELRNDPLPVAGRWIAAVEETGRATPGLVATVGRLAVDPNVPNCIPRRVTASLDVRHQDDAVRIAAVERLLALADELARCANLAMRVGRQHEHSAVAMDARLVDKLAESVAGASGVPQRMVSGAGHDAGVIASVAPTAMLFLRSPGGVSHHPAEAVQESDVALGLEVLVHFIQQFT
jgi:allantoate deiminase